ncbi:MAG: hypothetical protein HY043_23585 [Verrucomicrobia bacterium]|nr:hypothetical protein [Verrucomicrobiota bacterium]
MSNSPESELNLDLHFLPAWARQAPDINRYAKYEGGGDDERSPRRGDSRGNFERGPRPSRPPRRDDAPPRGRPQDAGRRDGPAPGGRGGFRRDDRREARPPLPQLPELAINFIPEEKGVDSLARQIRLSGRAYPLFEIAQLILAKPERYVIEFSVLKKPDGQPVQGLWMCNLDETLWLAEADAVRHVLTRHFATFYQAEKIPTDPPKGTYTFVAQCGMSGMVLGPPNYHDYQNKLRKLHAERFARVPFDAFKARVKIVRDEAIVKQWVEEQSFRTEYACLNVPEALKLNSREEVEKHFRATHLANIIKPVDSYTLTNPAGRAALPPPLQQLCRVAWEEQRRFAIRVATTLSQQFAGRGLQFFKVNKTVTHVSVARPRYLDMNATPVSEGMRRIVEFINATPNCSRRQLFEALVPNSALAPAAAEPSKEGAAPTEPAEPSPEMRAVISDLHWLVHEGHVIEFAKGVLETAKPPAPKPVKPAAPPKAAAPTALVTPPLAETEAPAAALTADAPVAIDSAAETNSGMPEVVPAASPEAAIHSEAQPAT